MDWNPTNTDDVTLTISTVEREDGERTTDKLVKTGAIVVDDFSLETEEDLDGLSGIGNRTPLGISRGDVEHSFSFTVQGEDADLFIDIAEGEGGSSDGGTVSAELEIIALFQDVKIKLTGAWAGTRSVSGSSGDPVEYEVEGLATSKKTKTLTEE